jgi:hypothetical protein
VGELRVGLASEPLLDWMSVLRLVLPLVAVEEAAIEGERGL